MNEKIFFHLSNPVKAKLILEIQEQGQVTTGQLTEKFSQIPQATLYRYVKKMLTDGLLKVVEERPVRGTVEKIYALGFDFIDNNKKVIEENDGNAYFQMATLYMLGILTEFKEYADRTNIDLLGDCSGFSHVPVYATTEELTETLMKIKDVLSPLINNTPGGERRLRNLCIITTPPKK